MKNRLLAYIVSICLFVFSFALPAYAVGGTIDTGIMDPPRSNEEIAVTNAIEVYFNQRELILTEQAGDCSAINDWYQQDENKHLAAIKAANAVRIDSTITIEDIIFDKYTTVNLLETVAYLINGTTHSEIIAHDLILIGSDVTFRVMDDAYYESITNFASCSYVPSSTVSPLATDDGSSLCIIHVAQNEVGYSEESYGYTKYGAAQGKPYYDWCVMFVSWCAREADVHESVIPIEAGTGNFWRFFDEKGNFHESPSGGGNPTPQAGDIIFFRPTNPDAIASHVGIVTGYSGSTVSYIDGNGGSDTNAVHNRTISINAYSILGFGRPQYIKNTHTTSYWQMDELRHWKACENCNAITVSKSVHSMYTDPFSGTTYCTVCPYGRSVAINRIKNVPIALDS